ncbi:MAG: acetolactate decarboxylase [Actinomycetales bacterium]|nr:acetolactate decarboxylase [Actinomycetales bacterium]
MPRHLLTTPISRELWHALQQRSRSSGQSIADIVQRTLAEALDLDHDAVFQVSTSGAIFDGVFEGFVTIGDLRRHGDFGIGTFDAIDGELIMLDGHCYQARSDGSVRQAPDDALTPFASVCWHQADLRVEVREPISWPELERLLDQHRPTENATVGIRCDGRFDRLHLRAACRAESGTDLATATRGQAEFVHGRISGTLVGFWTPAFARSIGIPGYHVHFISDDRAIGGHVLDLQAANLTIECNWTNDLRIAMPSQGAFLSADLHGPDDATVRAVEGQAAAFRDSRT